jgi:integrase
LVAKLLDDGCAPSTARLAVQKLRGCARAAVAEGLIGRDFTLGVRVPDSAPTRLVIPEAVDVAALLEAADDRMAIAVLLGADAGLRLSELLGLSSDRVSWLSSKPTVTVDRQSAKSVLGAPVTFTAPKTASSVRDIPVPAELLGDLAARLERTGLGEEGLLLHDGGRGWTKNRFHDAWRSLRSEAGLDGVRFHDLRHYFCSRLLAGGVNIAAVARAAGHSSPSVTLDTYSHVLGDDHEKIRAVLGGAESWLSPGGAGTGIAESV